MKHRLKGLLALVLSLVMVFALATNAWAAVTVGGVNKGDGTTTTNYKNGDSVGALTGGADNYNAMLWTDNGVLTLTLNNFAYNGSDGITATENLTIDLIGSNTVADTASATSGGAAVVVMGDLKITSGNNGSLNSSSSNNNGISANNITIDGANVSVGCNIGLKATGGIINIMRNSTVAIDADVKAIDCTSLNLNDDVSNGGSLWYRWTTTNGGTPNTSKLTYKGEEYLKIEPITYTVTFDANGHGTAPTAQTVASGATASEPTAPTADGWTFGGWYKEAGCSNAFDFNTAITGNITLYAKWTENSGGVPGNQQPSYNYPIYIPTVEDEPEGEKVTSSNTFDGGIASAVVVTILSATGGAWLAKKKD